MAPRLNIPPVTRGVLLFLIAQSLLSGAVRYRGWTSENDVLVVPYITLVPAMSLIYPWTLFTTTFVENNVFTLALSSLTLFHGGRYLERAWTSSEFAKFLLIVTVLSNIFAFTSLYTFFVLTGVPSWTLTPISGTTSLQIAFLTAFTQLIPTHTVTLFRGIISLRVPRFPLLFILAVFILNVVGLYNFAHLQLALNGFLVSWTYLRFFKPAFPDLDTNQSPALRGDASETFAFASFFPEVTRPAISGMADTIFNILVQLKICTPFSSADMQASRGESHHHRTVGSSRAETERRRALALKALDQRLNDAAKRSPQPQPPAAGQGQGSVGAQPKVEPPKMEAPGQMLGETRYELEHDKGSAQV